MPKKKARTRKRISLTDQLRRAIRDAEKRGTTRYQIAKRAGIAQSTLTQFYSGVSQHIRLEVAEKIAVGLGGQLTLDIKR